MEVSVSQLKEMIDQQEDFQLIDIRETYEYEVCNLGGELMPMGRLLGQLDKISKEKKVVVCCRSGGRSEQGVMVLEQRFGFDNLYNLNGGILA